MNNRGMWALDTCQQDAGGQKQTDTKSAMSALPPKADIRRRYCDVRFTPRADIAERDQNFR
jgi:hypothetical protein